MSFSICNAEGHPGKHMAADVIAFGRFTCRLVANNDAGVQTVTLRDNVTKEIIAKRVSGKGKGRLGWTGIRAWAFRNVKRSYPWPINTVDYEAIFVDWGARVYRCLD